MFLTPRGQVVDRGAKEQPNLQEATRPLGPAAVVGAVADKLYEDRKHAGGEH